jgi:hypothetical protein
MGRTQRPYDFPRSRGEVVSRMERLGARSKTAYRESDTNRFNPIPITCKGREIRFSPAISRSFVVVSSIWLQLIWMAVGSTVKTRDLVKLNNNSIPSALLLIFGVPTRSGAFTRHWAGHNTNGKCHPRHKRTNVSKFRLAQRLERTAHLLQRSAGSGGMFAPGPPGPG